MVLYNEFDRGRVSALRPLVMRDAKARLRRVLEVVICFSCEAPDFVPNTTFGATSKVMRTVSLTSMLVNWQSLADVAIYARDI